MGERHPGQGNEAFGPVVDFPGETVGAADDEHQRLPAPGEPLPDPFRPFDGTVLLPALVQQDDGIAGSDLLQDQLPLFLLDLFLREGRYVLQLGNLDDREGHIVFQPGHIQVQAVFHPLHVGPADCHEFDVHSFAKIRFAALLLLTVTGLSAQDKGYDVFVPIGKYIAQGDAASLSAWFADNLEVSIISSTRNCSKTQARQIVKTFFDTYTPRSFDISHKASRSNMKYALGQLNAGGEVFIVTLFVSSKADGTYQIQQFKIDRQTAVY